MRKKKKKVYTYIHIYLNWTLVFVLWWYCIICLYFFKYCGKSRSKSVSVWTKANSFLVSFPEASKSVSVWDKANSFFPWNLKLKILDSDETFGQYVIIHATMRHARLLFNAMKRDDGGRGVNYWQPVFCTAASMLVLLLLIVYNYTVSCISFDMGQQRAGTTACCTWRWDVSMWIVGKPRALSWRYSRPSQSSSWDKYGAIRVRTVGMKPKCRQAGDCAQRQTIHLFTYLRRYHWWCWLLMFFIAIQY